MFDKLWKKLLITAVAVVGWGYIYYLFSGPVYRFWSLCYAEGQGGCKYNPILSMVNGKEIFQTNSFFLGMGIGLIIFALFFIIKDSKDIKQP